MRGFFKSQKFNLAFVLLLVIIALAPGGQAWAVQKNCTSSVTGIPVPCLGFQSSAGPAGQFTISDLIITVIDILLWFVGLLSVLFLIIGGFQYVVSRGNEEQTEAAKKTMTNAIIGVVIVVLSFVIIRVITSALITGVA